ncbi:MAG TPA: tryptophan synthase subunit beta, partial [Thermoanaerobaculia bacterium]|nr:tryptophan synthase subunit beta [Thermoanaerobaculia bacterium]
YPAIGPEHAYLADRGRIEYTAASDAEAIDAFHRLARSEGILPALESSHALVEAIRRAPRLSKERIVLVNLSGRGDKDLDSVLAFDREEAEKAGREVAQ